VVRTIRISETETLDDGSEVTRTVSGRGIIIRIRAHVPGMKPSDVRRDFVRTAKRLGVVLDVCETAHGHYAQSGEAIVEGLASAYQCVGLIEALGELVKHVAVEGWTFALNVAPPRSAQGSGPEKVRPSMGSTFGKPLQVKATADALAKATADKVRTFNMSNV
jgi:hypothetical protein